MRLAKSLLLSVAAATILSTALFAAPDGDTTLAEAAKQGNKTVVRSLLKRKPDVNVPLPDGTTALHWAAYRSDLELVKLLLDAGANPRVASRVGGNTPLTVACISGNAPVVDALLKAGADPNVATSNGTTPLMIAASSGSMATVNALLNKGADINARESVYGQTALMFASAKNRTSVIRTLINRGADWKLTSTVSGLSRPTVDEDGNPIQPRRGRGEEDTPGATPPQGSEASQTPASGEGAGGRRRRGAASGDGENTPANRPAGEAPAAGEDSQTPRAGGFGRGGFGEGAGGGAGRTFGGNTALTLAAREGHLAAVQALIESGADINQPNAGDKTTPITTAICNGHFDVAKYMLDKGANPNLASVDGLVPLYAVIDTQWAPVGWAPNPITDQQKINYLGLMKALLDKGADPNAKLTRRLWFRPTHHNELWINPGGSTAFWRAAQATDIAAMRLLLAGGADPKIATTSGINALMVAAGLGWNGNFSVQGPDTALDTVKLCLELGLDPTPADTQGYTAVMGAAYRGDNEMIKLLVEKGAKLDSRTTRGWSVTDMANGPSLRSSVPVKHPETVALLRKLGAPELTATDNEEILGVIRQRPQARPAETQPGSATETPANPAPAPTTPPANP